MVCLKKKEKWKELLNNKIKIHFYALNVAVTFINNCCCFITLSQVTSLFVFFNKKYTKVKDSDRFRVCLKVISYLTLDVMRFKRSAFFCSKFINKIKLVNCIKNKIFLFFDFESTFNIIFFLLLFYFFYLTRNHL